MPHLELITSSPQDPQLQRLKQVILQKSFVVAEGSVRPVEDVRELRNRRLEAKISAKGRL